MKMSKKVVLKTTMNKSSFMVARALGCSLLEVCLGDYKYCKADDCKYVAILGSADFAECENLDLSKLKYVKGNLVLNDSVNLTVGVEYVGKNVFGINAQNVSLPNLKEAGEGIYLRDATVASLQSLDNAKVLYVDRKLVEKRSAFVVARAKKLVDLSAEK